MLSKAAPNRIDLSATQALAKNASKLATRRIWLPKLLYDALPYFYLTAGFAAFFATLYISDWFWVLPHYLIFSAACLQFGFAVQRRRQKNRSARAANLEDGAEPATTVEGEPTPEEVAES